MVISDFKQKTALTSRLSLQTQKSAENWVQCPEISCSAGKNGNNKEDRVKLGASLRIQLIYEENLCMESVWQITDRSCHLLAKLLGPVRTV